MPEYAIVNAMNDRVRPESPVRCRPETVLVQSASFQKRLPARQGRQEELTTLRHEEAVEVRRVDLEQRVPFLHRSGVARHGEPQQPGLDAITTLPLNKEALRLAGIAHPGHTEILAERCGVADHAMMLYLAAERRSWTARGPARPGRRARDAARRAAAGLRLLSADAVAAKIRLADRAMRPLTGGRRPRVAVSSLNPHAGEHGLFGDEEIRIIRPAVEATQAEGLDVDGPLPQRHAVPPRPSGAFDAVVAMYHDQGHIALKTAGFRRAVNVTLGLPIVRTSVAHGTAFDIAWQGVADPSSLIEAVRVAARLVAGRARPRTTMSEHYRHAAQSRR